MNTNRTSLENVKKAHFIGIGGISMSGLAEVLSAKGIKVTGSDIHETELTKSLLEKGMDVSIGQRYENVAKDCDLIIYTAAVKENNPEIAAAKDLGIKIIDRAELLGIIMDTYKYSVGISGTHGKTTTTSMVSEVLLKAGFDPTLNIGGIFTTIGSNYRIGSSDYFVAESCEYFDSFSKFYPYVGAIINIEHDHTDYFKTMEQLEASFARFASNIAPDGLLVINCEISNIEKITSGLSCNIRTYGTGGDYEARNISFGSNGKPSFDLYYHNELIAAISLNLSGTHNVENAMAAFACCDYLGVPRDIIAEALEHFAGTKRRFEFKGEFNGINVIDDYAHHPTEIAATLSAARKYQHNRIVCAFQPHTYTRTKAFLDRFANSLSEADMVVLLDIYSAREASDGTIHSRDLEEKINELGKKAIFFDGFKEAEDFLLSELVPGDMLITMGAGDINKLGENMLLTALSTLSTD